MEASANKTRTPKHSRLQSLTDECCLALDHLRNAERAMVAGEAFAPRLHRLLQDVAALLDEIRATHPAPLALAPRCKPPPAR